jgi:predicted ATPase/DNA-binding SARP family transcriptional activator
VALLGPVALVEDGRGTSVAGEKQRTLLALLALAAGEPVSADALVDELWPFAVPSDPANALQARISAVRKVVGAERLRSTAAGYVLDVPADDVDACRFEELVETGRHALGEGDHALAAARLEEAIGLWSGAVALADVPREGRVQLAAERLEGLLASAYEARVDADLALGRHERAATELRTLVTRYPLRERLREQLMLALYRSGRQAEALTAYQDARHAFADELGLDPGPALSALESAILRHDPSLLPEPAARPTIPRPLTSFVGRTAELDGIAAALADDRLVTVVGPGGVGKTRLAAEVALRSDVAALWVALDSVDGAGVLPAIAVALGVREEQLDTWVGPRPMLLVLDNCEQVVDAVASVVENLLGRTSSLRVLATSREALGIGGERLWPLAGLPAEDATALFEARAPATVGDAALASLCAELDGLPLAIELAAARTNVLSPAEIVSRLGNRFSVLSHGTRTAVPRHQTLRALVDWSYELLFDDERRALAALSVFRNRFTMDDAEAVCSAVGLERGDVVDVVGRLVAKSLVTSDRGSLGLLVTIRDYGAERLDAFGLVSEARRAHAMHLVDIATTLGPSLLSGDQLATIDELAARDDDLTAALDWCEAVGEHGAAVALTAALGWYWYVRGTWWAARRRLESVLGQPSGDPVARGVSLGWLGHFALVTDADVDVALVAAREQHACGREAGDEVLQARADVQLVRAHVMSGDMPAIAEPLDEATRLLVGRDEPFWAGWCPYFASVAAFSAGRVEEAESLIAEAVACFRRSGERWSLFNALLHGGTVLELRGRLEEAARWFGESLVHVGALRFRSAEARARVRLASVSEALGDADMAAHVCAQCLNIARELDDGTLLNTTRVVLARVARTRGELSEGDALTEAVLRAPEIRHRELLMIAINERGFVLAMSGRRDDALALHREALRLSTSSGDVRFVATALEGVAGCLPDTDAARSAMLLGAAETVRGAPVPGTGADRAYVDAVAARARAAHGDQLYDEALESGRRLSVDAAIDLARRDDHISSPT